MSNTRYPFPAAPDGWFSVAASDDVGLGDVKPLHYLGRDIVAFRDEDGTVRIFDAHCPHLGAHLGVGGRVCGDGIVCPFHGWRFDGAGSVVEVPHLDRRPPRVKARVWDACERNGRIFVWHHAGGASPQYDVTRYRDNGARWTPWSVNTYRVRIGLQDLTENIIDRSHFWTVHDMDPPDDARFDVTFEGPSMVVDQFIKVTAVSERGFEVFARSTTCGPGIVAVEVREGPLDMLTYITQTPVDDEITEITLHFSMIALDDEAATASMAKLNDEVTNTQFIQDIPIWENKIYRERPPLTAVDGPIAQYRRWFRQFYSGLPSATANTRPTRTDKKTAGSQQIASG